MAYNYEYPYFDSGQFNVDWLLATIKKIEEELSGTKTYDYKGENEVLDLNELRPNSMASFTENFNVLNAPVSGARRFVFTNGSNTGGLQRCYDLKTMEVYARNFTITNSAVIWASWTKTQLAPGNTLHSILTKTSGDMNDMESNTATLVDGNSVLNSPTNGFGFTLTWKSRDSSSNVQLWFNISNSFLYLRFFTGSWSPWVEANHINLIPYLKSLNAGIIDLNTLESNRTVLALNGSNNLPRRANYHVLTLGSVNSSDQYQVAFERGSNRLYLRTGKTGSWHNIVYNDTLLYRQADYLNPDDLFGCRFNTGTLSGLGSSFVMGMGYNGASSATYQIGITSNLDLLGRFRDGSRWGVWAHYQRIANRKALITSNIENRLSHDSEGNEYTMISDNIYTTLSYSTIATFACCPGQSLYHSDPDAQSYSEAIRAREDLTNFDAIITNLEQWDMDIPLTELLEKTREFVQGIKDVHPLADIVILSVPPIDVPFLGKELYSYTWPSVNTLTEVDDALTALAQEVGFSYITWKDYKHIDNTNLLRFYDNLYEEPVYKRSLESYVSRQVKNCIE